MDGGRNHNGDANLLLIVAQLISGLAARDTILLEQYAVFTVHVICVEESALDEKESHFAEWSTSRPRLEELKAVRIAPYHDSDCYGKGRCYY